MKKGNSSLNRISWPIVILCILLNSCVTTRSKNNSFYFIQMSDPQFGMYTDNKDFEKETEHYEKAIQAANRLKPAFVVVTGDLVNRASDPAQIAEFKRISHQLNPDIPLYSVAGNHDVGNTPNTANIASYRKNFGADYYAFNYKSTLGIVLNSVYLHSPENVQAEAMEQEKWLLKTLEEAKSKNYGHIMVFLHHPFFLKQPDEADEYFNIPKETRKKYLDIFKANGIRYVFAGHYHQSAFGTDGSLQMITTGPVGKPLGNDRSGFRIVIVDGANVKHEYYSLDSIPRTVNQ
jgi:3',5'-cyclic AMP phosphodiesterase CpdA